MLDTKGPEIRSTRLREGKNLSLVAGQELEICNDHQVEGDIEKIACNYKELSQSVSMG